MTTKFASIWEALSAHADGSRSAMFFELGLTTGWEGSQQRLDAWSINLWPSLGKTVTAYEVKVSRSDFVREIKNPEKRIAGLKRSNEFYFATTARVVKSEDEIPPECGWLLFDQGELKVMREAPHRECAPPDWPLVRAICRRAFDSEVIAMKRKLEQIVTDETSRANRADHRVIDQIGEWLLTEAKGGDPALVTKLKVLLEPTNLYQWVEHRAAQDTLADTAL